MVRSVRVERHRGTVAELHGLDRFAPDAVTSPDTSPDTSPVVWWCDPADAAIVLGSRQSEALLDLPAVRRAGLAVVRRRSGGGAVVVDPDVVWIDLIVPAAAEVDGAPDVFRDVRRSMVWAGERWRAALAEIGLPSERLSVHTDGMVETAWSPLVCFAGFGPGEVLLDDRKFVGLSQRRTRRGVMIQGQLHRSGSLAVMPTLFAPPTPGDALDDAAEWPAIAAGELAAALARAVAASVV